MKLIWLDAKQARKSRQRLTFLPVSKARTNKFFIFRQCMYIYIALEMVLVFSVLHLHVVVS